MDDYSLSSLTESKNEWCARLVSVLSHCVINGVKSIFDEAVKLCIDTNEENKYLMTFQNLLSQIPQWNPITIENERKRIEQMSGCKYLEDLITCVHIIQLKALTCIRVGQKQKKIDIDIPSIDKFIHQIYINSARKLYTNIYLFEKDVYPLTSQKNNREFEVLIKEAILTTIRDNIPVEQILKAYIDETEEQEVNVLEKETLTDSKADSKVDSKVDSNAEAKTDSKVDLKADLKAEAKIDSKTDSEVDSNPSEISVNTNQSINFSNVDSIIDSTNIEQKIDAPKDLETLEKKAVIANEKRKEEEREESEEYGENIKLNIGEDVNLDIDMINLSKPLTLDDDPILDDVEVL